MFRPFCYGLICFVILGSSFALRQALSSAALPEASAALETPQASSSFPSSSESYPKPTETLKSDKLEMTLPENVADKVTVQTTLIQSAPDVSPPVKKSVEVTTWHWHAGAKITKKTRNVADRATAAR